MMWLAASVEAATTTTAASETAAGAHAGCSVVLGAFEIIQVIRESEHHILLEGRCAGIRYHVFRDCFTNGSILMQQIEDGQT